MGGAGDLKKYFYLEESPYMETYSVIAIAHSLFPFEGWGDGSYNLMPARLLGLSYAQYLRFCRDVLGAKVVGKGKLYPIAYFRNSPEVQQFLKLLNERAKYAIFEHDHPYDLEVKLDGTIVKKEN